MRQGSFLLLALPLVVRSYRQMPRRSLCL
jgi:hypothetical protein